jgi:putative membrane protein
VPFPSDPEPGVDAPAGANPGAKPVANPGADPDRLDPDARFLLANERTLLAWLRTSLTLQAGGVGLLHFAPSVDLNGVVGLALLLVGAVTGLIGFSRYRAADRAIRRGALPAHGLSPEALALIVAALASVLLIAAVVHLAID